MSRSKKKRFTCIGCGAKNRIGAEYCSGCGYRFAGTVGGPIPDSGLISIPPPPVHKAKVSDPAPENPPVRDSDRPAPTIEMLVGSTVAVVALAVLVKVVGGTLAVIITFVAFFLAFFVTCAATFNDASQIVESMMLGLGAGLFTVTVCWVVSTLWKSFGK